MNKVQIPVDLKKFKKASKELEVLNEAMAARATAHEMIAEQRYIDALERTVQALRTMRDFPASDDPEFRAILIGLLFDLAEIHFALKDYKQSEKELETLFKVLEPLLAIEPDRFGELQILAMELSTRILRTRKKTIDMLVKQQINTGQLYEKVNAGVAAATDRLVDSLRKTAQLLASTGDYRGALKFWAEAIKFSKKRTGRVTRKELTMTIEMAEAMMRVRQMRPRAKRLLEAVLPHAIALETIELEENILALLEILGNDEQHEPVWRQFIQKVTLPGRRKKADSAPVGAHQGVPEDGCPADALDKAPSKKSEKKKSKKA